MSKPISILTAIICALVLGCIFAYHDIQKYGTDFQAHPNLPVVILTDFFGASLSVMFFYFASRWLYRRKGRKLKEAGSDKFYDEVARELQEKTLVAGLWTKAFSEAGGDDAKARALYIKYRVAQLAEAGGQQQPEEQKRDRNIKLIIAASIFAAAILVAILGVITTNKNVNAVANDLNNGAVAQTEQLPAVQTPAESEFDKQKKLAEKGDLNAQEAMDFYYRWDQKNYAEAFKWSRMAADQGNADAEYSLGTYYANGIGVEKDEAEAAKWYRKAAEQGNGDAENKLGDCYAYGWGVETNLVEASKWYSLAARYYGEKARLNQNK